MCLMKRPVWWLALLGGNRIVCRICTHSRATGALAFRMISEHCMEKILTNIDRLGVIQERIVWCEAWLLGSWIKRMCVCSGRMETFPGPDRCHPERMQAARPWRWCPQGPGGIIFQTQPSSLEGHRVISRSLRQGHNAVENYPVGVHTEKFIPQEEGWPGMQGLVAPGDGGLLLQSRGLALLGYHCSLKKMTWNI